MTKTTKPIIRRVLAGVTLAGALTLPLGGMAAATDSGPGRAPKPSGVEASGPTGPRSNSSEPKKSGPTGERSAALTAEGLKVNCTAQITRRLADLDKLTARVAERADVLTADHKTAITAIITSAKAGLVLLQGEIGAATTVDALKPLCQRIFTDFRIYALRLPQVNVVLAADAIGSKQATFATLRTKLVDAIALGSTSENRAELDALLAEFDGHVLAMKTAADGVADPALAITPAEYNANPSALKPYIGAVRDARKEAKAAAKSARKILELLSGDEEGDHAEHEATPGAAHNA